MKIVIIISIVILSIFGWYFFGFLRCPERIALDDATIFLSPANGTISEIVERSGSNLPVQKRHRQAFITTTQDVGTSGYLISISMDLSNVHYQRAPLASVLVSQKHTSGSFVNVLRKENLAIGTYENERNEFLFETSDGIKYKVIQIAGFVARRIESRIQVGQIVKQSEIIGLIKLGSQVSLVLPRNVEIFVSTGQIVVDGETQIAKFLDN